jgi:hypothetical protein
MSLVVDEAAKQMNKDGSVMHFLADITEDITFLNLGNRGMAITDVNLDIRQMNEGNEPVLCGNGGPWARYMLDFSPVVMAPNSAAVSNLKGRNKDGRMSLMLRRPDTEDLFLYSCLEVRVVTPSTGLIYLQVPLSRDHFGRDGESKESRGLREEWNPVILVNRKHLQLF